ncbi:MAG: WbqC family protein [Bacteroidetes bacterium]|nr:WbqC family protein [Bacteroidota bacterium]MDA1122041.1 WbqC family protein [Bacteroidota bacterium]
MNGSKQTYTKVLIEPQLLPSLEYFAVLIQFDEVILDVHEHFVKQTFRNRCYILGPNKVLPLVIPVSKGSQRLPLNEVAIDYQQDWLNKFWASVQSSYGKAPFFEFYSDQLKAILYKKQLLLHQLSIDLLTMCLTCLGIDITLKHSINYEEHPTKGKLDLRSVIHPKRPFSENMFLHPATYTQIFGNNFVPNLSIVDLLFCEGPNALTILKKSID